MRGDNDYENDYDNDNEEVEGRGLSAFKTPLIGVRQRRRFMKNGGSSGPSSFLSDRQFYP